MTQLNSVLFTSALTLLSACAAIGDDATQSSSEAPAQGVLAQAAAPAVVKIDRSNLKDVGISAPLNYGDGNLWACRPGNDPNECHANLDATEILPDGTTKVVPHVRATDPKFDCFYIYPTVALAGGGNMTNFSDIRPVLDPLLGQGARFNRLCEVYAPLYRQVSLSTTADGTTTATGDRNVAVNDVLAAFDHYIANYNRGRNFVVIGHSQGAAMAVALLSRRIDSDAALRKRFISAVALGAAPAVPTGAKIGGSFQNIPTCSEPGQTGCLIAYVTYADEQPPEATPAGQTARFGRTTDAGQVACTEPSYLAGNSGNYAGSYFPRGSNNPSFVSPGFRPENLTTPFFVYRNYFKGRCVQEGAFSYLRLSINKLAGDTRQAPPYRNPRLEGTGWGLHLVDFGVAIEDLIQAVSLQAAKKLAE